MKIGFCVRVFSFLLAVVSGQRNRQNNKIISKTTKQQVKQQNNRNNNKTTGKQKKRKKRKNGKREQFFFQANHIGQYSRDKLRFISICFFICGHVEFRKHFVTKSVRCNKGFQWIKKVKIIVFFVIFLEFQGIFSKMNKITTAFFMFKGQKKSYFERIINYKIWICF